MNEQSKIKPHNLRKLIFILTVNTILFLGIFITATIFLHLLIEESTESKLYPINDIPYFSESYHFFTTETIEIIDFVWWKYWLISFVSVLLLFFVIFSFTSIYIIRKRNLNQFELSAINIFIYPFTFLFNNKIYNFNNYFGYTRKLESEFIDQWKFNKGFKTNRPVKIASLISGVIYLGIFSTSIFLVVYFFENSSQLIEYENFINPDNGNIIEVPVSVPASINIDVTSSIDGNEIILLVSYDEVLLIVTTLFVETAGAMSFMSSIATVFQYGLINEDYAIRMTYGYILGAIIIGLIQTWAYFKVKNNRSKNIELYS